MPICNLKDFLQEESNVTNALQKAIDFCFLQGGGEVVVPPGDHYIGGIIMRSNTTLHLQKNAHLIASRNPEDYMNFLNDQINPISKEDKTDLLWMPVKERKTNDHMNKPASRWNNAVIKAIDAENISIIGEEGSYIDGQDCFDELGEEHYRGPHAINMHRCRNLYFYGYEIKNSANWAHALFDCDNITAKNIRVTAGHDGIHLTSCDNITISDCNFQTGDDCIAGIDNLNVYVNNCRLNSSCSGFRFGGKNVVVEDCNLYGPGNYLFRGTLTAEEKRNGVIAKNTEHKNNMLSAFLYYCDFSRPVRFNAGNIVFRNCKFKNVERFLEYNFSGSNPWQRNKPLESIRFENITSEGIKIPLVFYCDEKINATLEILNCDIDFSDDAQGAFMHLCNHGQVLLRDVTIKHCRNDVLIKKWSDGGEIVCDNLNCIDFKGEIEKLTEEEFNCKWI